MSDAIDTAHARARTLRAGPLTLAFDGGSVRWIRLGHLEILRGIYVGVRDENWRTIPATVRDLSIDAREDSFRIEFVAEHRHGDVDFRWRGTIVGERSGTLTFTVDGAAQRTFRKNRIGLCVLHPMQECSGRPCTIEHVDGHIASTSFPALVSPHQVFLAVRAIAHEVVPGVIAEVRVEGEIFETEDQRNWSDTSFKTYGTPVDLPFPVEIAEGTRVRQEARLRVRGTPSALAAAAAASSASATSATVTAAGARSTSSTGTGIGTGAGIGIDISDVSRALPRIGLMLDATQPLSAQESTRLRALGLSHLRVDLDLATTAPDASWRQALQQAALQAEAVGVSLQIAALFAGDSAADTDTALEAMAEAGAALRVPIDAWLLFDRATGTSPAALLAKAREVFAGRTTARIGGGSNVHFADLNRNRPPAALLDVLACPMTPQAHAADADTMVENIGSIASVVDTARSFAGAAMPVVLSPVTLKGRSKSSAHMKPAPPPLGALPDHIDARQLSPFAAAWTLAHVRACAEAGIESVTYFRTVGWDGVMERENGPRNADAFPSQPGMLFPAYHALAQAGAFAGGRVLVTRSSDPSRVDALCLERGDARRLFLINLRPESQAVQLPPAFERDVAAPLVLQPFEIRALDFGTQIKKGDSISESPFK
jgi:D-apionolactonase